MRRALLSAAILLAVAAFVVIEGGASSSSPAGTYKIELDNAFGLVTGADFKVAGVRAGTIKSIDLPKACSQGHSDQCYALVTVSVTDKSFGAFHADAFCQSRPQSLIGEYFVECQPGSSGPVLKPGSTIPVSHTQSTIPADLLNDVMRMPYRERFTLIINELGAAVAARSDDLQAALRRAVPALTQTDNLLNLLADDSRTLQALTVNSDAVVTALANNSRNVQRFVIEANKAAGATAAQDAALQATWAKFPGFLEQLKPAMAKLGAAADANTPVLNNLNASASQLRVFFQQLVPFSQASLPALKSLGKASVTGLAAMHAAAPPQCVHGFSVSCGTIADLNRFAGSTPELAQNLAIVLNTLNDRNRAVERDSRSPGGLGYTGLEALLQYVFNQTLAINAYGQFGHMLAVDAFVDQRCSQYATPQSVAKGLATYGASYRQCYSWLGPNQPGINERDPSAPNACVPDPGGAPPGEPGPTGPAAHVCKLQPSSSPGPAADTTHSRQASPSTGSGSAPAPASGGGGGSTSSSTPALNLQSTIGQVLSGLGGGGALPSGGGTSASTATSSPSTGSSTQAQQLLNYLLAP